MGNHAAGLFCIVDSKHSITRSHGFVAMDQIGAALQGAPKLASRNHFLSRVATLLEIDATDRFVIQHLGHESIHCFGVDGCNPTLHLAPAPLLFCKGLTQRRRRIICSHPKRPRH